MFFSDNTSEEDIRKREALQYLCEKRSENNKALKTAIAFFIGGGFLWFAYSLDGGSLFSWICGIVAILGALGIWACLVENFKIRKQQQEVESNFKYIERDIAAEMARVQKAREEAAKREEEEKALAEKTHSYAHPECPICKSCITRRISTTSRVASVAFWGLASSKIGKQYECLNCKHKW